MISETLYVDQLLPLLTSRERIIRKRDFTAVSPLSFRYVNQELAGYTSESAKFIYWGLDEGASILTLLERSLVSKEIAQDILEALPLVDAEKVYLYEYGDDSVKGINHDVRAYFKCLCELIPEEAHAFTHAFKTSYDKINTADSARMRDAVIDVMIPALKKFLKRLIKHARKEARTVQVGRTHLQHASPVTFGFALAEFIERIGKLTTELEKTAFDLRGKLSGPTGTCAPTKIKVSDPRKYERQALSKLGLKPSPYSHQTTSPEYLVTLCEIITKIGSALGNLADNMRDLERPEINELTQEAGKEEGSSSVMPQKVNPIKWENVRSLMKVLLGALFARYQDLLTAHQRDLTNSASGRFAFEMLELLLTATKNATRALSTMQVNREVMLKNLFLTKDQVVAEPLNTILRWHGHPDAHSAAGRIAKSAHAQNAYIYDILMTDQNLVPYVAQILGKEFSILKDQKKYIGDAARTALRLSKKWEKRLQIAE